MTPRHIEPPSGRSSAVEVRAVASPTSLDPTAIAPLLTRIQQALTDKDVVSAMEEFIRLPAIEREHAAWLDRALRDGYATGRFTIQTLLRFLDKLPSREWILDGLRVIHGVHESLAVVATFPVQLPWLPVAFYLRKLLDNTSLDSPVHVRAMRYWREWVSPTMRAVVVDEPVFFESVAHKEVMYAPADDLCFDDDRRHTFTWGYEWTTDEAKEHFRLLPVNDDHDEFFLYSVNFDEYLYAADEDKLESDDSGAQRCRVFGWRSSSDPPGPCGRWQFIQLDTTDRSVFALYNAYHDEWMFPAPEKFDEWRRFVLTRKHKPDDPEWNELRKWRVLPMSTTGLERAIEAFATKRYAECVEFTTAALMQVPEFANSVECLMYRMAANLRMGAFQTITEDFSQIERLGGEEATRSRDVHHLWNEVTAAVNPVSALAPLDHKSRQADHLFVSRKYADAVQIYREIEATLDQHGIADPVKSVILQQSIAKCHFALGQVQVAHDLLQSVVERDDIPVELTAHLLLWIAKCKRRQRQFDAAMAILERAVDLLDAPKHALQRQSVLGEVKVTGIFRRELLERLLTVDGNAASPVVDGTTGTESCETAVHELLSPFHCPLSLELLQDPVLTPSGNTYERAMIERHLETNGNFDPLTRAPVTRDQLYPNRAIKLAVETLMDEHRLGRLLRGHVETAAE